MDRAKRCLALYYEPDRRVEDRIGVLESFGRALRFKPLWAVLQAFDRWEAEQTHRPSPGHITALADKAIAPFTRELAEREKAAEAPAPQDPLDREAAARICEQAGFTPQRFAAVERRPMAGSEADLYAGDDDKRQPHWTESVAPDDPRMDALARARAANPMIQAARADAERAQSGEGA